MPIDAHFILLALMLIGPPTTVHAQGFKARCQLALTTARTKGVRMALQSWPHLATSPALDLAGEMLHRDPSMVGVFAARTSRHVGHPLDPLEYEAAALATLQNDQSSYEAVTDALRLLRLIPLRQVVDVLKAARQHPALAEPSETLLLALNPSVPRKVISVLIIQAIHDEARADGSLGTWDVPYSARPAPRIIQLNREGRINDGSLMVAFSALFETRWANLGGIYSNLQFLEAWVKDLYVSEQPLPSRDLARGLTRTIRRRLKNLDGSLNLKNASFATLTRVEILLGS